MSSLPVWIEATRPKTLPAAVTPVLLGSALAFDAGMFRPVPALICLGFAILVQVGTNFANDYLDAKRGTDTDARIGPTRAVAAGLVPASVMRAAAIGTLVAAFCLGLGLIPFGGWWLLVVGLASVACAWLYTGGPYPLAYNGLGDIFVVLFFGLIAVGCTYFVQAGSVTADVLLVGFGCGLLINNLLVVNNYRDLEEDRAATKRTLVVRFGRPVALYQYTASVAVAAAAVLHCFFRGYGLMTLAALLPLIFSLGLAGRLRAARTPADFLTVLKASGGVVAAFGLLLSFGIAI